MDSMRWLTLRLNSKQSIGPDTLLQLWSSACESNHVSVSREHSKEGVSYGLHATSHLMNPRRAELRMRELLEESRFVFSLSVLPSTRTHVGPMAG
ncbi:MAG TPA: hypothetical protein DDZ67_01485 [Xanthomonadaceae bacterium]|nr:hypothetical protein [Xanthomonadaceae bacterium]